MNTALLAKDNRLGVGINIGRPLGVSTLYWLDELHALDFGLGFIFSGNDRIDIYGNYLIHKNDQIKFEKFALDWYFGGGLRIENEDKKNDDEIHIGLRAPVGLRYRFQENKPIDLNIEFAPILDLVEDIDLDMHLLFGARYYF